MAINTAIKDVQFYTTYFPNKHDLIPLFRGS